VKTTKRNKFGAIASHTLSNHIGNPHTTRVFDFNRKPLACVDDSQGKKTLSRFGVLAMCENSPCRSVSSDSYLWGSKKYYGVTRALIYMLHETPHRKAKLHPQFVLQQDVCRDTSNDCWRPRDGHVSDLLVSQSNIVDERGYIELQLK